MQFHILLYSRIHKNVSSVDTWLVVVGAEKKVNYSESLNFIFEFMRLVFVLGEV